MSNERRYRETRLCSGLRLKVLLAKHKSEPGLPTVINKASSPHKKTETLDRKVCSQYLQRKKTRVQKMTTSISSD